MKKLDEAALYESAPIVEGLRYAENKRYASYSKRAQDIFEKLHGRSADKLFMATIGAQLRNHDILRSGSKIEGVSQSAMPILRDYGFELITALFPGLIANDLFNVQPAKYKNYSIFHQDYLHGTAKGASALNSGMINSLVADEIDSDYTRDAEVNRNIGTGNGSATLFSVAANQLYRPLIAGTVTIEATRTGTSATMTVIDDGHGVLTGDVGSGTKTVDYVTGETHCDFVAAVKSGTYVYMTYEYLGEGSESNAMETGMTITETQGSAKERRLRFNYSIESQFAYRQQFGRSMDADLLAASLADIRAEIDGDLIKAANTAAKIQVGQNASAGAISWDRTPDAGVQYFYWREQFVDALHSAGNLIIKSTGFGEGNKVVGGLNFKQVVEILGPRVKLDNQPATAKGARKIGTIDGTIDAYYSPLMGDNEFFVTYKGGPLQVGLSYNPWMPLYTSEPHMLDNGKLHRYLVTSYGKVFVNRKLFVQGTLLQS